MALKPRQAVPALEIDAVGAGRWSPAEQNEAWTPRCPRLIPEKTWHKRRPIWNRR